MSISGNKKKIINSVLLVLLTIILIGVTLLVPRIEKALAIQGLYGAPRSLYIGEADGARNAPYTLGQITGLCRADAIYVVAYNETTSDTIWCDKVRIAHGDAPYAPYTEILAKKAKEKEAEATAKIREAEKPQ